MYHAKFIEILHSPQQKHMELFGMHNAVLRQRLTLILLIDCSLFHLLKAYKSMW